MAAMVIPQEPAAVTDVVLNAAVTWPDRARSMKIEDAESYELACGELLAVAALRKEAETVFGPIVKAANEAHRVALAQKAKVDGPLNEAEQILKSVIGGWQREQRRIADEEARRLREEAERAALEAREAEIMQAEAEDATPAEIAALTLMPVVVPHVTVRPSTPKVVGVSMRETWSAEVTDLAALVRFIAANPNHVGLLSPNMTAINQMARAMKDKLNIPGVKAYSSTGVAASTRRL